MRQTEKTSVISMVYPPFFIFYKSVIFLCFVCFLGASTSAWAVKKEGSHSSSTVKQLGGWSIKVSPKELALSTALSGRPLMALHGPDSNYIFIADPDSRPVSLKLIRERIKNSGGDLSSLRVRKQKTGKVFSFSTDNQVHWISTDGAYLTVDTKKPLTKRRYRRLLKRVKRSF